MNLDSVRELREKISAAEIDLRDLRLLAETVPTAKIDGLPHCRQLGSRVETVAQKVVDAEEELARLKSECDELAAKLFDEIQRRINKPTTVLILTLRFVEGLSFRKIARRVNYTLRQVFRFCQAGVAEFENFPQRA